MKKTLLVLVLILSIVSCKDTKTVNDPNQELLNETIQAVAWYQNSGEAKALFYQAFNTAKNVFDQVDKTDKKIAVVADLDETLIDNSAFSAWQIVNSKEYNSDDWNRWVEAKQAVALPGAKEFVNYINANGGEMFYLSNRSIEGLEATMENIKAIGFTGVDEKHVLLSTGNSNKEERRQAILDQGYEIVLLMGDNLEDFDEVTYHKSNKDKKKHVNDIKDSFGTQNIIMPNPMYGGFESGFIKDYFKKDAKSRIKARKDSLLIWDGK